MKIDADTVAELIRRGINTIPDMVDELKPLGRRIERQRTYDRLYWSIRLHPERFVKIGTKPHPRARSREANVYILREAE